LNGHSIIHTSTVVARKLILAAICSLAALLVPSLAQADTVRADLDGDGVRDRIEFKRESREFAIRFSSTQQSQRLRVNDLIVTFVLADVDRDGDPDLVANTRTSGVHVWINKGRGFFAARTHSVRTSHIRLTRHRARPAVRGVPTSGADDSTLNDCPRSSILASGPARERLLAVCEAPMQSGAPLAKTACPRRTPRGPPSILVS
jgi:hypothetical protein